MDDINALADSIFEAVKGYCDSKVEIRIVEALKTFSARLDQLPVARDGLPGENGKDGQNGLDGKDGADGPAGATGNDGEPGPQGPPGKNGQNGIDGKDGADGFAGAAGKDGEPGSQGAPGKDGEKGANGEAGVAGLNGSNGEPGPQGAAGKDGGAGPAGADGTNGQDGKDGIDGAPGADGRDGAKGLDGDNGRDALDLQIASEIDLARRYPRGSYAKHAGGLWRSFETTNQMTGWECVINGVAKAEVSGGDDPRVFTFRLSLSDGQHAEHRARLAAMLYRDVYRAGDEYQHGDTVTFGGSLWHCNVEKSFAKPGDGPDWTLVAKRGRDGRDAQPQFIPTTEPVKLK